MAKSQSIKVTDARITSITGTDFGNGKSATVNFGQGCSFNLNEGDPLLEVLAPGRIIDFTAEDCIRTPGNKTSPSGGGADFKKYVGIEIDDIRLPVIDERFKHLPKVENKISYIPLEEKQAAAAKRRGDDTEKQDASAGNPFE